MDENVRKFGKAVDEVDKVVPRTKYAMRMVRCPECNMANEARAWDTYTVIREGYDYDKIVGLAKGSREEHLEQDTVYRCPNCYEEVSSADLFEPSDVDYDKTEGSNED